MVPIQTQQLRPTPLLGLVATATTMTLNKPQSFGYSTNLEVKKLCLMSTFLKDIVRKHRLSITDKIKSKRWWIWRRTGKKRKRLRLSEGGAARTQVWWSSMKLSTDVPPSSLKGLLTHFDYSGPVVTENITSIRAIKWKALFFPPLPMFLLLSLPADHLIAPGLTDSKQSTNYGLRHLEE